MRAETLEDAFSSVHKSLGVPLRDPLLCTGRKRSSRVSSMGRAFALDKLKKPACQEQRLLATLLLTARVEEGLRDHSWSPGGLLPSDFKRRVCNRNSGGCVFFRPQESRGPSEGPSLVYRKKTILQSFVYGREPLLLTSSGNPLVKSKGFTRHPPLDGQSRGGPPGRPLVVSPRPSSTL